MTESIEVPAFPKSRWQKFDSYDLRLVVWLTALTMLRGSPSLVLGFGAVSLVLLVGSRLVAPEWRFIELDPETEKVSFVSVVLHWISIVGLWLAIGFYVWNPTEIKVVSFILGAVIYGTSLTLATLIHSWDTSEDVSRPWR